MRKLLWPQGKKLAPLFSLLFLTLLFAACSSAGNIGSQSVPTPTPMPTPTPAPRTPLKLLIDSQTAMDILSTEHLIMTMSAKSQGETSAFNINEKYEGDIKKPDQYSLKFNQDQQLLTVDQQENLSEVVSGNKLYVQNKLGKWFVIDNGAASTKSSIDVDQYYQIALQGNITDKGHVAMDGMQLRHIASTVSDNDAGILASLFGSTSSTMKSATFKNVTFDFWIDDATAYTHKMTMSFVLTMSSSRATITMDANAQANISNFNRPVTITIPANAIPATSLSEVEQS